MTARVEEKTTQPVQTPPSRWGIWVGIAVAAVIATLALWELLSGDPVSPVDQLAPVTWYLPEDLSGLELGQEADPPLWPSEVTVTHWRSGDSWIVVTSSPAEQETALLLPAPLSSFITASAGTTDTGGGGPEGVDLWVYTSDDFDEFARQGIQLSFLGDAHPEQINPPVEWLIDESGNFDSELQAFIQSFEVAATQTISFGEGPGAILASFPVLGFGLTQTNSPIPLELLPIGEHTTEEKGELTYIATDFGVLIATDAGVIAAVMGEIGPAFTLVPTDDLTWGRRAWPTMSQFLRLADLESDASSGGGCGDVIIAAGGCHLDLTPEQGPILDVTATTVSSNGDGTWTVAFEVSDVLTRESAEPGGRLGVVRQNAVVLEFHADDIPGTVEVTVDTAREAVRLATMLDPGYDPTQ